MRLDQWAGSDKKGLACLPEGLFYVVLFLFFYRQCKFIEEYQVTITKILDNIY